MPHETCEGCEHMVVEDAYDGCNLYICTLGKFDYPRGVFEHARRDLQTKPSGPIPAWCKLGRGKHYKDM